MVKLATMISICAIMSTANAKPPTVPTETVPPSIKSELSFAKIELGKESKQAKKIELLSRTQDKIRGLQEKLAQTDQVYSEMLVASLEDLTKAVSSAKACTRIESQLTMEWTGRSEPEDAKLKPWRELILDLKNSACP